MVLYDEEGQYHRLYTLHNHGLPVRRAILLPVVPKHIGVILSLAELSRPDRAVEVAQRLPSQWTERARWSIP